MLIPFYVFKTKTISLKNKIFIILALEMLYQWKFVFLSVPSEPPPGIQVQHKISLDTIIVMWSAIDEKKANGRFKGYKVKYTVEKIAGVDAVISGSNTKEIVVDKYTFRVKINGLLSYASYKVSVCGYTEAGNGPFSKAFLAGSIIFMCIIISKSFRIIYSLKTCKQCNLRTTRSI